MEPHCSRCPHLAGRRRLLTLQLLDSGFSSLQASTKSTPSLHVWDMSQCLFLYRIAGRSSCQCEALNGMLCLKWRPWHSHAHCRRIGAECQSTLQKCGNSERQAAPIARQGWGSPGGLPAGRPSPAGRRLHAWRLLHCWPPADAAPLAAHTPGVPAPAPTRQPRLLAAAPAPVTQTTRVWPRPCAQLLAPLWAGWQPLLCLHEPATGTVNQLLLNIERMKWPDLFRV